MNAPVATITPKLRHLILIPVSGMCNRLRAIASARRLCALVGAKCTVVWDWGTFWDLFEHVPGVDVVPFHSETADMRICHKPLHIDPSRTADVTVNTLELKTNQIFWGSHESKIHLKHILKYIPKLNHRLETLVEKFAIDNFNNVVGFHMRRTDQKNSRVYSPDNLFVERAHELVSAGKKIFLATDNSQTETKMKTLFGQSIIIYPKRKCLSRRWPRPFDKISMEDDLVELFLLVKTEYVLGSYWSSFSNLAIALNGSCHSVTLKDMNIIDGNI